MRRSKTNQTFFEDIPKKDKAAHQPETFEEYKARDQQLKDKKAELLDAYDKKIEHQRSYLVWMEKEKNLRVELMEMIG
jgi:hypothetical protein